MHITPRQRRRSIRVHYFRQQGHSLQYIADTSKTSLATVRADLKLAETHLSSIAAATADDLLLQSLHLLQLRLAAAIKLDRVANNADRRAEQRPDQPELFDEEPENPQELAETTPKLSQIEPPDSTISSPGQEIVQSEASEEKIPEPPNQEPEIPLPAYAEAAG